VPELKNPKSSQRWLYVLLKEIFPSTGNYFKYVKLTRISEIVEDFAHPDITMPKSSRPLQLDIFLPKLSLAFEYPVYFCFMITC
jgi:hypothetical protein